MAEYRIIDNVKDVLEDRDFSYLENYDRKKYDIIKIKVKEGVTSIRNYFHNVSNKVSFGIDASITTSVDSSTLYPCGEYVAFILSRVSSSNNFSFTVATLSELLSSTEVLYTPLPDYIIPANGTINIDSELFEAPNGLFDHPKHIGSNGGIRISGSFERGPRIHSDKAMEGMISYPPGVYYSNVPQHSNDISKMMRNTGSPFINCPNMESIEYQGDLGSNLQFLWPIDFTFTTINIDDDTGEPIAPMETVYTDISAYPRMSKDCKPKQIVGYIYAENVRMSSLQKVFNEHNDNLETCVLPFQFDKIMLDSVSELPFMGLNFDGLEMDSLILPKLSFALEGISLDDEENTGLPLEEKQNITFSLTHLGIEAPKSAVICENLHNIYTHIKQYEDEEYNEVDRDSYTERKMHHVSLSFLQQNYNSWYEKLAPIWGSLKKDVNDVPLVPNGIRRLAGYYSNILSGYTPRYDKEIPNQYRISPFTGALDRFGLEESVEKYSVFGTECARWPVKDGQYYIRRIPRVNTMDLLTGDSLIYQWGKNLYAYLYIDEPVTMVAPPKTTHQMETFVGTFAYTKGTRVREFEYERKIGYLYIVADGTYKARYGGLRIFKDPVAEKPLINDREPAFVTHINNSIPRSEKDMTELKKLDLNALYDEYVQWDFTRENIDEYVQALNKQYYNSVEVIYPFNRPEDEYTREYQNLVELNLILDNVNFRTVTGKQYFFSNGVTFEDSDHTASWTLLTMYNTFIGSEVDLTISDAVYSVQTNNSYKDYSRTFLVENYSDESDKRRSYELYVEGRRPLETMPDFYNGEFGYYAIMPNRINIEIFIERPKKELLELFNVPEIPSRTDDYSNIDTFNDSYFNDSLYVNPNSKYEQSPFFNDLLYFRDDGLDDTYEIKQVVTPGYVIPTTVKMPKYSHNRLYEYEYLYRESDLDSYLVLGNNRYGYNKVVYSDMTAKYLTYRDGVW